MVSGGSNSLSFGFITKLFVTALAFYSGYMIATNNISSINSISDIEGCPEPVIPPPIVVQDLTPVECEKKSARTITCPHVQTGTYYLHKNILGKSVFQIAFDAIRHPGSPAKSEFVYSQSPKWSSRDPFADCKDIILTRTGSKESTPNKCVAVAIVPDEQASLRLHDHRVGYSALLTNQYQNDHSRQLNRLDELSLLKPFLTDREKLIVQFLAVLGEPLRPDGSRRTATIMVANEGVMDLVLNFICSAKMSDIDLDGVIVFVGQAEHIPLLTAMGVRAMAHDSLGSIPARAAGNYADSIFTRLMWLK
eukprot:gene12055-25263_t